MGGGAALMRRNNDVGFETSAIFGARRGRKKMRNLGEAGQEFDDARQESRACCALCAVKEFLVVVCLFLIGCDLFDVYGNVVRVTGTDLLPFPGNHTDLYYTRQVELNYYDMAITIFDLSAVIAASALGP